MTLAPPRQDVPDAPPPPPSPPNLVASRLHPREVLRVGSVGLRTRRLRASLSALGIAIGIAAMVAVLGISESSKADVLAVLDELGTNLLTVEAGGGLGANANPELPESAMATLDRVEPVQALSSVTPVDANVYRTDLIPEEESGGITVKAADPALLDTLQGEVAQGRFLDAANSRYPVVVLGSVAADRLGVPDVSRQQQVAIGGEWFVVIGVLEPLELASDLDRSALIGQDVATELFDTPTAPGTVYLRADPDEVTDVAAVAAATANPEHPDEVSVSRPSDAIEARAATNSAFTSLFLGLGGVALLVGGVGIANVMVISVLERRSEIGLRRAIGATRRHITVQFVAEALLLALLGGLAGVVLGGLVTVGYDLLRGWVVVVPPVALGGGLAAALVIGAVAGLYPARRAARMSPTEALRTV